MGTIVFHASSMTLKSQFSRKPHTAHVAWRIMAKPLAFSFFSSILLRLWRRSKSYLLAIGADLLASPFKARSTVTSCTASRLAMDGKNLLGGPTFFTRDDRGLALL